MTDQNMEDSEIVPAPKLIEVFFQNCKGQVDQWVEPYLRLTIDRLRRTQKPYLKSLLLQVVRNTTLLFVLSMQILVILIMPDCCKVVGTIAFPFLKIFSFSC